MSNGIEQVNPWQYKLPTPNQLRIMRLYLDLPQTQVANDLGVKARTLRSWEKGDTSPSLKNVDDLLTYYRMAFYEKALGKQAEDEHFKV